MVMSKTNNQKEICSLLNMSNGNLQTYKKRLINKELITSTQRETIDFTLPRFNNKTL